MNYVARPTFEIMAAKDTQLYAKRVGPEFWDEGIRAAYGLLDADPWDIGRYAELARAFMRVNMYREAIETCSKGLALEPFNYGLLSEKAHSYLHIGQANEAAATLELACRTGRCNDFNTFHRLGKAYYMMRLFTRAGLAYEKARKLAVTADEKCINAFWAWINFMRLGNSAKAEALIEETRNLPGNPSKNLHSYIGCKLFSGELDPEILLQKIGSSVSRFDGVEAGNAENLDEEMKDCYGLSWFMIFNNRRELGIRLLRECGYNMGFSFINVMSRIDLFELREKGIIYD